MRLNNEQRSWSYLIKCVKIRNYLVLTRLNFEINVSDFTERMKACKLKLETNIWQVSAHTHTHTYLNSLSFIQWHGVHWRGAGARPRRSAPIGPLLVLFSIRLHGCWGERQRSVRRSNNTHNHTFSLMRKPPTLFLTVYSLSWGALQQWLMFILGRYLKFKIPTLSHLNITIHDIILWGPQTCGVARFSQICSKDDIRPHLNPLAQHFSPARNLKYHQICELAFFF